MQFYMSDKVFLVLLLVCNLFIVSCTGHNSEPHFVEGPFKLQIKDKNFVSELYVIGINGDTAKNADILIIFVGKLKTWEFVSRDKIILNGKTLDLNETSIGQVITINYEGNLLKEHLIDQIDMYKESGLIVLDGEGQKAY